MIGHGSTTTMKVPTKVEAIGLVQSVSCGSTHTLTLSADTNTVWSFGAGDAGKLGHGDTQRQTKPKVCTRECVCVYIQVLSLFIRLLKG